jgi:hypothetical protein
MSLVDQRAALAGPTSQFGQAGEPVSGASARRGFRPASRRRSRIVLGVILAAGAVGGNVLVYAGLDQKTEAIQVVRDVPAGDIVRAEDLRVVEVDVDATVPTVSPDALGSVVNQYARVHIASGSLMVGVFVQPTPLVTLGQGVVAVELRPTQVPAGLRERSRVELVVASNDADADFVTEGRVVARQEPDGDERVALSVEVGELDAAIVAAADDVRVVLLDPAADPAYDAGGS